jgi:hypothetical protein
MHKPNTLSTLLLLALLSTLSSSQATIIQALLPGGSSGFPATVATGPGGNNRLVVYNGAVYFTPNDGTHGQEHGALYFAGDSGSSVPSG